MFSIRAIFCTFLLFISASPLPAEQIEIVAGAGPSTKIVKVFFKKMSKHETLRDYRFIVPEKSAKHHGGILNSDNFLFGRTGRPLAEYEKQLGKREIILAKIPVAFIAGKGVPKIRYGIDDIKNMFLRKTVNWDSYGGAFAPIELVGRERNEAIFQTLKEEYPFFRQVTFDRVFHRDNEVMEYLASSAGRHSIAFGAGPNFDSSTRININGFETGIAVGLVYDIINENHPIVLIAKKYAASDQWRDYLRTLKMLQRTP